MKQTIFILLLAIVFTSTLSACVVQPNNTQDYNGDVKQFSSLAELNVFLEEKSNTGVYYGGAALGTARSVAMDSTEQAVAPSPEGDSASKSTTDFSTTNIQVQGVDEADIVKTDGKYIYYVTHNKLYIVDAKADNLSIISEIEIQDGYAQELFLNGDKLIVLGTEYATRQEVSGAENTAVAKVMPSLGIWYPRTSQASVRIYNISDKKNPNLEERIALEGNYADSRMIGDYAYVVFNKYTGNHFIPPIIYSNEGEREIKATDVRYFDMYDSSYELSIVMAINLKDDTHSEETFLKGSSQNMYVSENNIYLAGQKQIPYYVEQLRIIDEVYKKYLPNTIVGKIEKVESYDLRETTKVQEIQYIIGEYVSTLDEEQMKVFSEKMEPKTEQIQKEIQEERDHTIIHRISINKNEIKHEASGEVQGSPLNQFSMDEHENYFRIATTQGNSWNDNNPSSNNLYVLDMNLDVVGKIEDIAPQERIYSVRFMQDRAYMVTFRNIDPLFVIDLHNPENPHILGKLKIPGYSDYLHPYDETHIIGLGKETEVDEKNERAYSQGVKLALFDVSDVENPREIATEEIGDRGSDSEALRNHKAFLFDKEKGLLVIPVSVAKIDTEAAGDTLWKAWGSTIFQGAYVYSLNLEDGFKLRGKITHFTDDDIEKSGYWYDYNKRITRSLFIGDSLYTLSNQIIETHSLKDVAFEDKLVLFKPGESNNDVQYIE